MTQRWFLFSVSNVAAVVPLQTYSLAIYQKESCTT